MMFPTSPGIWDPSLPNLDIGDSRLTTSGSIPVLMICGASFSFWTYRVPTFSLWKNENRRLPTRKPSAFWVKWKILETFEEHSQKKIGGCSANFPEKTGDERQTAQGWQMVKLCETLPKTWLNLEPLHDFFKPKISKKCWPAIGFHESDRRRATTLPPCKDGFHARMVLLCGSLAAKIHGFLHLQSTAGPAFLTFLPSCTTGLGWNRFDELMASKTYGWFIKKLHEIMDPYIDTMRAWKVMDIVDLYILLHRSSTYLCIKIEWTISLSK